MRYCEDCYTELPPSKGGRQRKRCGECQREANSRSMARVRGKLGANPYPSDYKLLQAALQEIAPLGLTDDCPARQELRTRA